MKLLGGDGSPYVRKVRLVIAEKGLPIEYVQASPSNPDSGVAAANPLSKIPTLLLDNGKGLYDSPVIVEYLDGLKPSPKLIPDAFADRIEVKRWEALSDGVCDATVEISHDRRRPDEKKIGAEMVAKQTKKIAAGLAAMNADIGANTFCHNDQFSLADIACWSALNYVDRILTDFDWRAACPNLKTLYDRLSARPAFINH